jgi:hypothetical protein
MSDRGNLQPPRLDMLRLIFEQALADEVSLENLEQIINQFHDKETVSNGICYEIRTRNQFTGQMEAVIIIVRLPSLIRKDENPIIFFSPQISTNNLRRSEFEDEKIKNAVDGTDIRIITTLETMHEVLQSRHPFGTLMEKMALREVNNKAPLLFKIREMVPMEHFFTFIADQYNQRLPGVLALEGGVD